MCIRDRGKKPTVRQVVLGGQRVDDTDPAEGQAFLLCEPGNLVGGAVAQLVRLPVQETRGEQARDVVRRHRAVADPTLPGHHLDQWLEPHHPARTVADHLDGRAQVSCLQLDCHRDLVRADGAGRGVPGDIDGGHASSPLTSLLCTSMSQPAPSRIRLSRTSWSSFAVWTLPCRWSLTVTVGPSAQLP